MAQFASAAFTGTAFATLQSVDANWSKQTGYTGDLILGSTGAYCIRNDVSTAGVYQHSGSPASADYTVSADLTYYSAGSAVPPQMGVCGRMEAAAQTFYFLTYTHGSNNLRLFKAVAGTLTQLGSSYTVTLANNTPRSALLRMEGDQISGELDGSTVIGPVTDTAITAAGKAGIYGFSMRQPGVADSGGIDNFSADDVGGGGGSATVSLTGGLTHGTLTKGRLVA